ncbi:MAG: hypothetical protein AB8F74_22765 [Saprospiraceae bacterium]
MKTKSLPFGILFFLLSILQINLNAQNTQRVNIQIAPEESFLLINGELIEASKRTVPFPLELKTGKTVVELWSPKYKRTIDTIHVKEKQLRPIILKLETHTDAYLEHQKQMKVYNKNRSERILARSGVAVGVLAGTWFSLDLRNARRLGDLKEKADKHRILYSESLSQKYIDENRELHKEYKQKYNDKRRNIYLRRSIGLSVVAIGSYFGYRFLKKINKKKIVKPTFVPAKNPFVLNGFDLSGNANSFAFNLNFKF